MDLATEAEVERMLPLVNARRREQALRFAHTFGRFCCLKSWLMLRDLLGDEPAEWTYNQFGKPYIPSLFFSISHCKTAIIVAVSDREIGVDIESDRSANEALIAYTMNDAEQALIRRSPNPERAFVRLWTQKEALLKAKGTGIVDNLKEVLANQQDFLLQTVEKEKYIYTICTENRK